MKKTGFKAAVVFVLAVMVLAGQALAGPGVGGRRRGGGPGPKFDRETPNWPGRDGPEAPIRQRNPGMRGGLRWKVPPAPAGPGELC
ncbi:MAG: hypothetical protein JSV60_05220, partial [Desulfobacterales bacterium]